MSVLTRDRASVATIVRIPYVKYLADETDFLYATVGIAIWSICELGMGITASSLATLRPLFRNFFMRSRLMGGTSDDKSKPWSQANSRGGASGYIRSKNKGGGEAFQLRSDIPKNTGVSTVIDTDLDLERQGEHPPTAGRWQKTGGSLNRPGGWNSSESKLAEASSDEDEPAWRMGIRKTTISTQVSDPRSDV